MRISVDKKERGEIEVGMEDDDNRFYDDGNSITRR